MDHLALNGVASSDLRSGLRDVTRALHDEIEAIWTPAGGFASRQTYLDFLSTLLLVHRRLGAPAALRRGDPEDVIEEHRRVAGLTEDLDAAPSRTMAVEDIDEGFAWGVGYVLNGSSLGAAVLLKAGALGEDWPTRYLMMGRDYVTSGRLKRFFDALNAVNHDPDTVQEGAFAAFEQLGSFRGDLRRKIA